MDSMVLRRLILSLYALGLAEGQSNNLKYLVAAPAVMSYPLNETICVYVRSPELETKLVVSLKTKAVTIVLKSLTYKGEGQLLCNTFEVPPPTEATQEIATIQVAVKSGDLEQSESKSVMIAPIRNGMFVQTDRPIYQPGDKIIVKAVDFTEKLIAKNGKFTLVTLQDYQGNMINQWKNVEPRGGIMELSCNLSPDIALGDYKITVKKNETMADVTVTVDKYVMPKFEFTLDAPSEVTILQSSFSINMCGKYTYDKPVRGHVTGKLCRIGYIREGKADICKPINGETNVHGCYTMNVDTEYLQFKSEGYDNYIEMEASLEEDGTGVEMKNQKSIQITSVIAEVRFTESRSNYKSGLVYRGLMTLTGADGLPMPDEDIELFVNEERSDEIYTTDKNGVARFSLDSDTWGNKVVNLRGHHIASQPLSIPGEVNPMYYDGYAALIPFYTRGKSQLKIRSEPFVLPCNEKVNLWADFTLDPSEFTNDLIEFNYMVIANGRILLNSRVRHNLAPESGLMGFFPFPVSITSEMSPAATFLIYAVLSNGDLLADSIKIPVISCFPNTVSLQFSEVQSLPGSLVSLHITAYPNSTCNVRAVDKSIELLKLEDKRAEDTVNEFLKQWDIYGYPSQLEEFQKCPAGSQPVFIDSSAQDDTYTMIKASGIKVLTNFVIQKPLACRTTTPPTTTTIAMVERVSVHFLDDGEEMLRPASIHSAEAFIIPENFATAAYLTLPPPAQVRKEFPATWLMNYVFTGPTGQLDYSLKTPDTITQWNVEAFCTASIGLGFSPRSYLQVFKPYFLELILPYSVKQGETLFLKAIVLNFMKQCIKVQVTLYQSKDFQQEPCANCSYTACLCSDPTYTFTWNIKPLKLGTINITIGAQAMDTTDLCDGQKPIVPKKGQSDTVRRRLIVESHGIPVENTRSLLLCAFESDKIPLAITLNEVLGSQTAEVTVTGDIMGKSLNNLDNLVKMSKGCGEQNMMLLAPTIVTVTYYDVTGQLTDEIMEKAKRFMENGYQNELNYKHSDGSYSAFGMNDSSGSTWLTAFVAHIYFLAQRYIYIYDKHIKDAIDWLKSLQQEDGCFKNVGNLFHKELQGGVDNKVSLTAYVVATMLHIGDSQNDEITEKAKNCLVTCMEPQTTTYTKALCAYTFALYGDIEKKKHLLEQLDKVVMKKDDKIHWSNNLEIPEDDPLWSKPKSSDVETTAYVVLALVSDKNPSKADLGAAVPAVRWLTSQQTANGGFATTQDTVVAISALSSYGSLTYTAENSPVITVTNDKGFNSVVSVNPKKQMDVQHVELPDIPAVYTLDASGSGCAYVQLLGNYLVKRTETSPSEVTIYLEKVGPTPIQLSMQVEQQSQVNDLKPALITMTDYYEPSHRIEVNYEAPCN